MKKILCNLLLGVLATSSFAAVEVDKGSIYADKPVRLLFNQGVFSVEAEDGSFDIPSYNVRGDVKRLSNEVLEGLLSHNDLYFRLDCERKTLNSNLRLRGGGERWNGFKTWLVGAHPGWEVFKEKVLPKIAEGTVLVIKTIAGVVSDVKK